MTEPLHGVLIVDKPIGPTSFAIVRQARHATGARKVGHGGTLDPLATGVLPICFGEATKLAQFLLDADKEYEATIRFGSETDTYDAEGKVTAQYPVDALTVDDVQRALGNFVGDLAQVPPMYSALKRDGRPLHEYARAGETVERPPRAVRVYDLKLHAFAPMPNATPVDEPSPPQTTPPGPEARVFIRCSKGTYVRSIAHDLGVALGTGAHLTALRRTRSGPFSLERAIAPDAMTTSPLPLIALADALAHLSTVVASGDVALALVHGKQVAWERAPISQTDTVATAQIRILSGDGQLLAVANRGEPHEWIRTLRVFRPNGV
jgi:tRNA pseudouridine55 synthase